MPFRWFKRLLQPVREPDRFHKRLLAGDGAFDERLDFRPAAQSPALVLDGQVGKTRIPPRLPCAAHPAIRLGEIHPVATLPQCSECQRTAAAKPAYKSFERHPRKPRNRSNTHSRRPTRGMVRGVSWPELATGIVALTAENSPANHSALVRAGHKTEETARRWRCCACGQRPVQFGFPPEGSPKPDSIGALFRADG